MPAARPSNATNPTARAPVYGTVQERVLLRGARSRIDRVPAIYGTRRCAGWFRRSAPKFASFPRNTAMCAKRSCSTTRPRSTRTIPAVTRTEYRRVKVSDGGYAWEYRTINGKRVLCKVKRKAVYDTVAETVVVKKARVVHERVPAQWGYQKRAVLVAEERREAIPSRRMGLFDRTGADPAGAATYIECGYRSSTAVVVPKLRLARATGA